MYIQAVGMFSFSSLFVSCFLPRLFVTTVFTIRAQLYKTWDAFHGFLILSLALESILDSRSVISKQTISHCLRNCSRVCFDSLGDGGCRIEFLRFRLTVHKEVYWFLQFQFKSSVLKNSQSHITGVHEFQNCMQQRNCFDILLKFNCVIC